MADTDEIVDLLGGEPIDPGDDNDIEPGATDAHVCAVIVDGEVCGATFDNPRSLHMHKIGKHRDRAADKPASRPKGRADRKPTGRSRKKAPTQRAASQASAPNTDRATIYTTSIATLALGGYMLVPAFDEYDLTVITSGAPPLGAALAQVAEQNDAVRAALDLALGGGSGGAYVQLLMAALAIGVPIAAHHGLVPGSAGDRFGAMIGVAASPPTTPDPQTRESDGASGTTTPGDADSTFHREPNLPTFDPDTPTTDFDSLAMTGRGPTVVAVPDSVAASHVAGEPNGASGGSEQLNPERDASVPT